jgi:hypothetical protein
MSASALVDDLILLATNSDEAQVLSNIEMYIMQPGMTIAANNRASFHIVTKENGGS